MPVNPVRDVDLSGATDLLFDGRDTSGFYRLIDPLLNPDNLEYMYYPRATSLGAYDLDGDGELDHVMFNNQTGQYVAQMSFQPTLFSATQLGALAYSVYGFADIDGDGADEAIARHDDPLNDRFYILDDMFNTRTSIGLISFDIEGTGDFNGDGRTDLLMRRPADGAFGVFDTSDPDNFFAVGRTAYNVIAIGDFNGDGADDLLTRNTNRNGHFYLFEGDTNTPFATPVQVGLKALNAIATGDFDGDGSLDLLMYRDASGYYMLTNNLTTLIDIRFGNDTFEAIGDFNGDGMDDILLRRLNGEGRIVYSGDRSTSNLAPRLIGRTVEDIGDYDGNGAEDVLLKDAGNDFFYIAPEAVDVLVRLGREARYGDLMHANGIDTLGMFEQFDINNSPSVPQPENDADIVDFPPPEMIWDDGWMGV